MYLEGNNEYFKEEKEIIEHILSLPVKLRKNEALTCNEIKTLLSVYGYEVGHYNDYAVKRIKPVLATKFAVELHSEVDFKRDPNETVYIDAFNIILEQETNTKKLDTIVKMFNKYSSFAKGFESDYDIKFEKMEPTLEHAFFNLAKKCYKKAYNIKFKEELEQAKILEADDEKTL